MKMQLFNHMNELHFKHITIENSNLNCNKIHIIDHINAALNLLLKTFFLKTFQKLLNSNIYI